MKNTLKCLFVSAAMLVPALFAEDVGEGRRNAIVKAVEEAGPAVVSITVAWTAVPDYANPYYNDPFFNFFFEMEPPTRGRSQMSLGSGVIVHKSGYIVTNSHVVKPGQPGAKPVITVHLSDGREFSGKVMGLNEDNDISVIKISAGNLPVAKIKAKGGRDYIGEWVIAIGNPFGYLISDSKPSVTVGVISALDRNFSLASGIKYFNMIQTDASINPGNSGGALVNADGALIGINTFILTGGGNSSGSIGVGFAIPIDKVLRVVNELIKYGYLRQWTTGIYTAAVPSYRTKGIAVAGVERNSPAAKAGVEAGDLIISVEGQKVSHINELLEILRRFQVGDAVKLGLNRKGKELTVGMILEERK